jgi:hypothetical protein
MITGGQEDGATGSQHQAGVGKPRSPGHRTPGQVLKDIVLFFAAPFITLAYMPLFAFIGLAMLIRKDSSFWRYWHATD